MRPDSIPTAAIQEGIDTQIDQYGQAPTANNDFDKASERWAIFSLRTFRGNVLVRALAISQAIAEFTAELSDADEAATR